MEQLEVLKNYSNHRKVAQNMSLRKEIEKFLESGGYLPLSRWHTFEIDHGKEKDEKQILTCIKDNVGRKSGLYLYKKNERLLYVGKAKLLYDRLKSHYWESYKPVSGDRKKKESFHHFFSTEKNCGHLSVYWIEVTIEDERVILEAMLQYILNPEFK